MLGIARASVFVYYMTTRALSASGNSQVFYVSASKGNDSNPGTEAEPFGSINRCAWETWSGAVAATSARQAANLTCMIESGIYRENVVINKTAAGHVDPNFPVHRYFRGTTTTDITTTGIITTDTTTVISGLRPLEDLQWRKRGGANNTSCVFMAELPPSLEPFEQLFYNGDMMVEARWPNLDVSSVGRSSLSRDTWRTVGRGSRYGVINDDALAQHNFSWVGALATLNVAHQFFTWTRNVTSHNGGTITYPKDLPSLASFASSPNSSLWGSACTAKCNQYFLSGKLGALDAEGEWFRDQDTLHFMPPSPPGTSTCSAPTGVIEVKARDYAIEVAKRASGVHLVGLTLLGATLAMTDCRGCSVAGTDLRYPTFNKNIPEVFPPKHQYKVAATSINGSHVVIKNLTLSDSNNGGVLVTGEDIQADNLLVTNTDWMGTLTYLPLGVIGNRINITRATVSYFGNAGVVTRIPNTPPHPNASSMQPPPMPMAGRYLEVSHSHIHHGGTVGMDTAALYTGGWESAGLHWHHNWIHDASEKCLRGDDQSQNMTVHHNVIFNCGSGAEVDVGSVKAGLGIILKGDGHTVYANTIFGANYSEMCLPACVSPLKPFRRQYPLEKQNVVTQLFNTVAQREVGWPCSCRNETAFKNHPGGVVRGGLLHADLSQLKLQDPSSFLFYPGENSPLIDAGVSVPPYTDGHVGAAPDIGAYERGGVHWVAGCVGLNGCMHD